MRITLERSPRKLLLLTESGDEANFTKEAVAYTATSIAWAYGGM
jgi:hypothetical protein